MADASVENHVNSDNLAALADNVNVVLPPNYVAVPAAGNDGVNVREIINLTGEETVENIAKASTHYGAHPIRTISSPIIAFSDQDAKRKRDEELLQPDEDDEWEQAISKSVKPTEAQINLLVNKFKIDKDLVMKLPNQKAANEKIDRIIARTKATHSPRTPANRANFNNRR